MSLTKVTYSMIAGSPANAVDFGVVADGATDDSAALQAAFDYATLNGCKLILPSGIINIESPVIVDATANGDGLTIEIEGQGSESTIISYTDSADVDALSFIGDYASRLVVSGFQIQNNGASTGSNGIFINKIYGAMFNDIRASAFRINISCVDVNSLKFLRLMSNAATYAGMIMELGVGGQSYPNLNDFDTCNFINNYQHAILIENGTNNTFRSCNFGQNGDATEANSATIRMTEMYGGNGGGFTLVENCYFENNYGKNFWATCNGEGAYNFINNSFNKINAGINVTNHIYLDATPLSSGTNFENRLVMVGNSFAKLNGYTGTDEDVVLIYGSSGYTNFVVVDENVYGSKTETPTTYNLPAIALNTDRTSTTNKISQLNLRGKDSVGYIKTGGGLKAVSQDANWVNSNLNVYVVKADVETLAAYFSSTGAFFPFQATTAAAPTYVKGGMYFDTTLNKLRIGGATGWETVTST